MQWVLVTGGAKRLGAQLCVDLAAEGYSILVHYRTSKEEAYEVADRCRSFGVHAEAIYGDFSSQAGIEYFIRTCQEQFTSIKVLINNVGQYLVKPASKTTLEEWHAIFQTNLHVPFALCSSFANSLCRHKGSIINIGIAGLGNVRADVYSAAYNIAKTGLWTLTKSLAKELAPSGVRVNMVSPGYLENAVDLPDDLTTLPMSRAALLSEVTRAVIFLLNDQNGYITGQNIEVAGGVRL